MMIQIYMMIHDLEEMANDNGRWMMMSDGKSGK